MHQKLPVYILAGGLSKRMGTPKALLPFGSVTLLQYIKNNIKPIASEIHVISDTVYPLSNSSYINDNFKNIGPAGGIQAALQHLKSNDACILSCDTPFVNDNHIQYLLQQHSTITIATYKQKTYPLLGIYSKSILFEWEQLIMNGEKKLVSMLDKFEVKFIDVSTANLFNDKTFININTPEQYKNALQWL